MSILMPIAPSSKSTITAVPIHITRISFFSVLGSFWSVIAFLSFREGSRTRLCWPQAWHPGHQPLFIVENRAGAATEIAFEAVVSRRPDGYAADVVSAANAIKCDL